jgi:hypothetical protein
LHFAERGKHRMVSGPHLYGGFNLSPYLALKVFEAVKELTTQSLDVSLSHVDDDNCEICRQTKDKSPGISRDKSLDGARDKETGNDAAQPGRSGREWAA